MSRMISYIKRKSVGLTQIIRDCLVGVVFGETFFLLRFTPPYGVLSPRSMFHRTLSSLGNSYFKNLILLTVLLAMLTRVVAMMGHRTASSLLVKIYRDLAEWVAGVQSQNLLWRTTECGGFSTSRPKRPKRPAPDARPVLEKEMTAS